MSKKNLILGCLVLVCVLTTASVLFFSVAKPPSYTVNNAQQTPPTTTTPKDSFFFTVSADLGADIHTDKLLKKTREINPDFQLTLGDLSYSQMKPETAWCDYVKRILGDEIPFEIIAGNHESNGADGLIDNFIKCLPNKIPGVKGDYGKEYYFDYPQDNPIVRFILISPELTFTSGGTYSYLQGTTHFNWLTSAIDGARGSQIPWIIVGMHKDCIHPGQTGCANTPQLMNYLIQKKVDLVLQAHAHVYSRSKQLTCLIAGGRGIIYDDACVVKNSLGAIYKKGEGSAFVTVGSAGQSIRPLDPNDDSFKYLEKAMLRDVDASFGILKIDVTKQQIRGEFVPSEDGKFRDSFVIKQ